MKWLIVFGLNKPCTIISWGGGEPNSTSLDASWVEAVGSERAVNFYAFSIMKEEKVNKCLWLPHRNTKASVTQRQICRCSCVVLRPVESDSRQNTWEGWRTINKFTWIVFPELHFRKANHKQSGDQICGSSRAPKPFGGSLNLFSPCWMNLAQCRALLKPVGSLVIHRF